MQSEDDDDSIQDPEYQPDSITSDNSDSEVKQKAVHVVGDFNIKTLEINQSFSSRPRKGRKRKYEEQTRTSRKINKYSNKPCIDYKGKRTEPRRFTDFMCNCILKCANQVPVDKIQHEFTRFWDLKSYDAHTTFIGASVSETTTKDAMTTPYHPASNGMIERCHKVFRDFLSHYVADNQRDWDEWIPYLQMAYCMNIHNSTGYSPYFLIHGRDPVLPFDNILQSTRVKFDVDQNYVSELISRLNQAFVNVKDNLTKTTEQRNQYFNSNREQSNFQSGDLVYLHDPAVKSGLSKKLIKPWTGPYRIIEIKGPVTYKIKELNRHKEQIVHGNRLKLCNRNEPDSVKPETEAHYQQLADNFDIIDFSETNNNASKPDDNVKTRDATLIILDQLQRTNNIQTEEISSETKQTIDKSTNKLVRENRQNLDIDNFGSIVQDNVRRGLALIAYDCENKHVNITAVSIRDIAPCPDRTSDYKKQTISVHVIQRNDVKHQQVQACLVEITRIIYHCGMYSHTSLVAGGISNFIHPLGAEACRDLHKHHALKLYHDTVRKIQINGTTTASMTFGGRVTNDGTCDGTTYIEDGQTWTNVVAKNLARTTLQYIWGWFTDTGMVMSGLIGFYTIFKIIKYILGTLVNGLAIYRTAGCGLALIASVWNTLAMWIVDYYRSQVQQLNDDPEQNIEELSSSQPLEQPAATTSTHVSKSLAEVRLYPVVSHWTEQ
ncbi:hypothetical protein ILUMI_21908 [Ignelater luminosus]|uniref:Integrase p58-like C-terminal domain-containing protein n=1 Tax=Ignelater luminosus TaxID=2038154 RepID=A0A8K0CET4_IGNLU|nr:hypothetical protein ILUMI_21908 [Ignelater luminosus]